MIWLVVIHILLCFITCLLRKKKIIIERELLLPIVICVPIWGFLSCIIHTYMYRNNKMGTHGFELEKMKMTDQKYRHIEARIESNESITVPLEEAILINDAKTRRSLMLDILHKNPTEYIGLLQRAKTSSDVELTHYATTTIMEVQNEFELRLQKCEQYINKDPEDEKGWKQYLESLRQYINSGLISSNILMIQRIRMEEVLEHLLSVSPENKEYQLLSMENSLEMNHFDGMEEKLRRAKDKWPEERVYRLYVMFYHRTGQGKQISALLQEIKDNNVYLYHEGKEWFRFWSNGV